jgi:hypothetical protein
MAPASSTSILKARFLSSGDIGSPLGHRELVRDINDSESELFPAESCKHRGWRLITGLVPDDTPMPTLFIGWREWAILSVTAFSGLILRHASRSLSSGAHSRDPLAMLLQDEVSVPHGEERVFARLEP